MISKWRSLTAVLLATYMVMLDITVVNVALPHIQRSLGSSFNDLRWVVDAYVLTLCALLITAGSLGDRFGRRRMLVAGLIIFTIGSTWCGGATDPLGLNLARSLQGVGAAVLYASGPAILSTEFDGDDKAKAFGLFGAVTGLAIASGPLLGGMLADISWRLIFFLNVPIALLAVALLIGTATSAADSRRYYSGGLDPIGVVLSSASLGILVYGFIRAGASRWTDDWTIVSFVIAVLLLGAFLVVERRREDPMLDLELFRGRTFNGLSLSTLFGNICVLVTVLFIALYLQGILGYSAFGAGVRVLPLTGALLVGATISGLITNKTSPRLMLFCALFILAIGQCVLGLMLGSSASWITLVPGMIFIGIGMGMYNPMRAFMAAGVVPEHQVGLSSGISETFQQLGGALGIAALGTIAVDRIRSVVLESPARDHLVNLNLSNFASEVASGNLGGATHLPASDQGIALQLGSSAFVSGFRVISIVGGAFCAVGATLAILMIRDADITSDGPAPDDRQRAPGFVPAHGWDPARSVAGEGGR